MKKSIRNMVVSRLIPTLIRSDSQKELDLFYYITVYYRVILIRYTS